VITARGQKPAGLAAAGGETRIPLRRFPPFQVRGCRFSDLRFVRTSADRWCLLLSVVCRSAADLARTGEVRSHLVVDASKCCCRRTRDGIGRRGEDGKAGIIRG
jgi:hypothetical protein